MSTCVSSTSNHCLSVAATVLQAKRAVTSRQQKKQDHPLGRVTARSYHEEVLYVKREFLVFDGGMRRLDHIDKAVCMAHFLQNIATRESQSPGNAQDMTQLLLNAVIRGWFQFTALTKKFSVWLDDTVRFCSRHPENVAHENRDHVSTRIRALT